LERERGVDGVPMLLLLVPPGVEGRWLDDGVEGRWLEDGVLGLPLLLMGDSFGPDLPMATSIKNRRKALLYFRFLLLCRLRWRIENDERSEITQLKAAKASSFFCCRDQTKTKRVHLQNGVAISRPEFACFR
jgi:hypothetical protein